MANNNVSNILMEDAKIIFRNLSGEPDQYNKAGGKRTFSVLLDDEELAIRLKEDGWNVKPLRQRDPDDPIHYHLPVEASYKQYPPRVYLISGKKKTELKEDTISSIDYAEIEKVDLVINPYQWDVNGKSGIKAYLKSMYVTVVENALEKKYRSFDDDLSIDGDDDLPFDI